MSGPPSFDVVRLKGRRFLGPCVGLYVLPNQLGTNRLAIRVAKRFVPLAVMRNRIKRIFRESFRKKKAEQGGHQGFDVLMVCRSKDLARKVSLQKELRDELQKLWGQVPR